MAKKKKYVHAGKYVAEVEVERVESEGGWAPYLSLKDARKLDNVREALKNQDLKTASRFGRVFRLEPVFK